jgi:succinoglycan biosynthesis transport protein ExoP
MDQPQPNQRETNLHAIDYWQVVKNRYGVILLTFVLVFMTVAVITSVYPKKYESKAVLQVVPRGTAIDLFPGMSSSSGTRLSTDKFLATEFEVIKAQKTLLKAVDALDYQSRWGFTRDQALMVLQGCVETETIRGTDHIKISVRHKDPVDARDIATEVAKAYQARRKELENDRAEKGLKALDEALREQADKVEDKRKVLNVLARQRQLIPRSSDSIFGGGQDSSTKAAVAGAARQNEFRLEQDIEKMESQMRVLESYNNEQLIEYTASLDVPDNLVKGLYPQYLAEKRQLQSLTASGLGPNHPVVQTRTQLVEEMRKDLDEGVHALRNVLRSNLETYKATLARLKSASDRTREEAISEAIDANDYVEARKDVDNAEAMLIQMGIRLEAERISLKLDGSPIILHEEPTVAVQPVSPNVGLNLGIGALAGLIFGLSIAFLIEYFDTSVKTLEDVERYLQVPVLAVIPQDVGILHKLGGMSPDAEAYRILRTNIEFNRKNPEDNSITVVSGGAGEGKSTTLVNLAYICAQGGYTTLMIDGDLRRPRLHTFFDISNSIGLSNYLTTDMALEEVILQTPVENLYFMPSGILPTDAAGILNSRRMSELLADVKQRFDLVLVDSPPILGVSDASVLASEVDLTMIVVQHRKLPRNMLVRVKQAVENVGGHVIGVVLNNVDISSDNQYQYYTSYYTYYTPSPAEADLIKQRGAKGPAPAAATASAGTGRAADKDLY